MYKWLYEHFLSKMDPEKAHRRACRLLKIAQRSKFCRKTMSKEVPQDKRLNVSLCDIKFPNPLGMAAGFDKYGTLSLGLGALGFGFVETGTVTLHPRKGNIKPRIWREDNKCLRNFMGLPSPGCEVFRRNLILYKSGVVGVSLSTIGDNDALQDHERFHVLYNEIKECADYFTINISCPNVEHMINVELMLSTLSLIRHYEELYKKPRVPVFLKFGPIDVKGLKEIVLMAVDYGVDGFIATNTLPGEKPGGLSGPCLKRYGIATVKTLYKYIGKTLPIIGVGGISDCKDVLDYIKSGASLVQLYTSFVYEGPRLPRQILQGLLKDSDENGWGSITDLIGVDV